jgi:hypothetical protein
MVALILGILTFCTPLMFLSSIPAWLLGRSELTAIDAGLAPAAGRRCAFIGKRLGIIGTALSALALLGVLLMVIAGIMQNS